MSSNVPPPPPPPKKPPISVTSQPFTAKLNSNKTSFLEELRKKRLETEAEEDLPEEVLHAAKADLFDKVTCSRCGSQTLASEAAAHKDAHSAEVLSFLYLGGERNAHNKKELMTWTGVFHILNVAVEVENVFAGCRGTCYCARGGPDCTFYTTQGQDASSPLMFHYVDLKVKDSATTNMLEILDQTYDVIESVRILNKDDQQPVHKCLVHCVAGISRSSTVVIAYVMRYKGWCLRLAYDHVKKVRSIVAPIPHFVEELQRYEAKLAKTMALEGYLGSPTLDVDYVYSGDRCFVNVG